MGTPSRRALLLAFVVMCAIWSSTWLVIKEGLTDLPPLRAAAMRFSLAALVFAGLAPWLHRKEGGARPTWSLRLGMGLLNFAASYGIVYWGETVLPSGLASVLWATFPMMVAVVGHFALPEESLSRRQAAGFAIAFAGVGLLFVEDLAAIGPEATRVGALFLLSPLASAFGNIQVKRRGSDTSSALLNRDGMVIGALALWLATFALEPGASLHWTPRAVFSIVYLALVGTVLAFGLYFWVLRHSGAKQLSLIAYVIPVAAVAVGVLAGGETLTPSLAGGTGLVVLGVWFAARRPRAQAAPSTKSQASRSG